MNALAIQPKNSLRKSAESDIVERRGQTAFTTSLALADGAGVGHQTILRHVRKHQNRLEQLGLLGFEIRPRAPGAHGGGDVEVALLNEDQASFVLLLTRNTPKVVEFKYQLVLQFRRMRDTIARLFADPPRKDAIQGKRDASRLLTDSIVEWRAFEGKKTAPVHFMSEQRLCNWVVTGRFESLDERMLSNEDVDLLRRVREMNAALIAAGIEYNERKKRLVAFAMRQRNRLLEAA